MGCFRRNKRLVFVVVAVVEPVVVARKLQGIAFANAAVENLLQAEVQQVTGAKCKVETFPLSALITCVLDSIVDARIHLLILSPP